MSATNEQIRDTAREVFSRQEFHREKGYLERFLDWLARLLEGSTPKGTTTSFGGGFGGPVVWVILIVLAAVLGYIVYRILRGRVKRAKPEVEEAEIEVDEHRSTKEWESAAERFEREGEWKEALRCRYRELVGTLIDRDAVSSMPGRTTGELRTEVAWTVPSVIGPFSTATRIFELAWYADVETGPDENAQFRALAAEVLAGTAVHTMDEPVAVAA